MTLPNPQQQPFDPNAPVDLGGAIDKLSGPNWQKNQQADPGNTLDQISGQGQQDTSTPQGAAPQPVKNTLGDIGGLLLAPNPLTNLQGTMDAFGKVQSDLSPTGGFLTDKQNPTTPTWVDAQGQKHGGEAYYGEGLQGWLKKTYAGFADPSLREEGLTPQQITAAQQQATSATQDFMAQHPDLKQYQDYFQASNEDKALNAQKIDSGGALGAADVALTETARVAKTAVLDVMVGGILQMADFGMRKLQSAGQTVGDVAGQDNKSSTVVQAWSPAQAAIQWGEQHLPPEAVQFMKGLDNFSNNFNPLTQSANLLRYSSVEANKGNYLGAALGVLAVPFTTNPLTSTLAKGIVGGELELTGDQKDKALLNLNLQGSQMVYTQMWDPMVRSQIQAALVAGTPTAFVADKFTNPWAELGGSLTFDPLRFIDPIAGAMHDAQFLHNAEDMSKIAPEISDLAKAMSPEAQNSTTMAETVKSGLAAITEKLNTKSTQLTDLAENRGLFQLTSDGKSYTIGNLTGRFTSGIISESIKAGDSENAAALLSHMFAIAGESDAANAQAHVAWLMSAPGGKQAFSDQGFAAMALMRNMLEDGKSVDTMMSGLLKAGEGEAGIGGMAEYASNLMQKAADSAFPSVSDIKEADPERYAALPAHVKALDQFLGEDSAAAKLYQPFNRFFAGVYMGLSPAYAVRHMLGATLSIMADTDIAEAGKALGAMSENVIKTTAGTLLHTDFGPGALHERNVADIEKVLGSMSATGLKSAGTLDEIAAPRSGFIGSVMDYLHVPNFLKIGENAQTVARTAVFRHALVDTLDQFVRVGLPGADGLKQAGFSSDQIAALWSEVRATKDVEGAAAHIAEGAGIPAQRLVQMPEQVRSFLRSAGMEGAADEVMAGNYASKEEFQAALDKIYAGIKSGAEQAKTALSPVNANSSESKVVDSVLSGMDKETAQPAGTLFSHMAQTFRNARAAAYGGWTEFAKNLPPSVEKDAANAAMLQIAREPLGEQVAGQLDRHKDLVFGLAKDVAKGKLDLQALLGHMNITFPSGRVWNVANEMDLSQVTGDGIMKFINGPYKLQLASAWWGDFNHTQYAQVAQQITRLAGDGGETAEQFLANSKNLMQEGQRLNQVFVDAKGNPQAIQNAVEAIQKGIPLAPSEVIDAAKNSNVIESGILKMDIPPIDEARRAQEVKEVIDNPGFAELKAKAKELRAQRAAAEQVGSTESAVPAVEGTQGVGGEPGITESAPVPEKTPAEPVQVTQAPVAGKSVEELQTELDGLRKFMPSVDNNGEPNQFLKQYEDAIAAAKAHIEAAPYVAPPSEQMHTMPQALQENLAGFTRDWEQYRQAVTAKWGQAGESPKVTTDMLQKLEEWKSEGLDRMAQAKQTAVNYAMEKTNFAIPSRGDVTTMDRGLSFMYPYEYWTNRSYGNWMQRMAYSPGTLAAYGQYRRTLEQLHSRLPDYWKYNLSTNDLPGMKTDHPMMFNLESSLNPLNGITGVDFNDPQKRVDWLSRTVDDAGKFGPSLFTPINWLVAAHLYQTGQQEAALRWTPRLIPETAALKSGLAEAGVQGPTLGAYGKYNEYDPITSLLQGGMDPYESARAGRALAAIQSENPNIPQEQFIDAAHNKSGPLWDAAVKRAQLQRAPGQLMSFIGGVGFQSRSPQDMQVDSFYSEFNQVMAARSNMSPDDFRQTLTALNTKYPFGQTVLLSRKADDASNSAFAYNVLGRIPPGQATDLLKTAGISPALINQFYADKGVMLNWTPEDRSRFMAAVGDMGTLFAMPSNPTKQEWDAVHARYNDMHTAIENQMGDKSVWDKVGLYYNTPKGAEQQQFLTEHPEVQQALTLQSQAYVADPLLYKYYGSINTVTSFYTSQMYATLDQKFGNDIGQKWTEYYNHKDSGDVAGARAYWAAHPELGQYADMKAQLTAYNDRAIPQVTAMLPSGPPVPLRADIPAQLSSSQQALETQAAQLGTQQGPQWSDWQNTLGTSLSNQVVDFYQHGMDLSAAGMKNLNYLAPKYGYKDGKELLRAIGVTLYQGQEQGQP